MGDSDTSYTDVLIIGAGPAGLMTAVCLTRLNIRVKIIDKRLADETAGHADGIQPRTIEIWESLAMGEKLRQSGTHVYRTVSYQSNKEGSGIERCDETRNISVDSARYPFELILHPEDIEALMVENLDKQGIKIQQPVVPSALSLSLSETKDASNDYPVEVTCTYLNEERLRTHHVPLKSRNELATSSEYTERIEVIRAKHVVGCDGAHSWVRDQCNMSMDSTQPGVTWGVMDLIPRTNFPTIRSKNIILSPLAGALGTIPRPDNKFRMYTLLDKESPDAEASTDIKSRMLKIAAQAFLPYVMQAEKVTWYSQYTVVQRVASAFAHKNRVFIAGDACHVHSPNAGQGANVSMSDAYNLAWKLAYAVRGWGGENLLNTYEDERRPCSLDLIALDKELHKLHRPGSNPAEEYVKLIQGNNLFTTGIGLEYHSRLIVPGFQSLAPGLLIGQRLPPGKVLRYCDWNPLNLQDLIPYNLAFKVLIFAGDVTDSAAQTRLNDFVMGLGTENKGDRNKMIQMAAILHVKKMALPEEFALPQSLLDSSTYLDDDIREAGPELYRQFGISTKEGAVVLVRPDGHVAMIIPFATEEVYRIGHYMESL